MIDWDFIGAREGDRLTGYVPNADGSKSGVTIADGVDLSAQSAASLAGLPQDLIDRLSPYLGLRNQAALDVLAVRPLAITPDEADQLNAHVRAAAVALLTERYNAASAVPFDQLPDQAQTVIASVAFQYGSLAAACPHFWRCVVAQDWIGAVEELRDFGDAYPTRRNLEADYLAPLAY